MDRDVLVNKRVAQIARDLGCTVDQVNAALDKHPIELDRDQFLRRTLALELIELDQLQQAFRDTALEDRDVGSGLLLLKVAERRATLLGLNAPQGHAVQIIQHEPAGAETSTDKIAAAVARIRGKSLPKPDEPDDPEPRKFTAHRRGQAALGLRPCEGSSPRPRTSRRDLLQTRLTVAASRRERQTMARHAGASRAPSSQPMM